MCLRITEQLPEYSTECKAVINALEACVIKSGCSGFAYQHSHGLSIYFPWAFVSPDYRNLQFAQVTGWYDFLEKHIKLTQREPRYGGIQIPRSVAELPSAKQRTRERLIKLKGLPERQRAQCEQEVGDNEINREIARQFRKILAKVDRGENDQDRRAETLATGVTESLGTVAPPTSSVRSTPRQPAGPAHRRRRRSRNAGL